MRYLLAALAFVVLSPGCSSDAEDRAFFEQGWVQPEKAAEERLMKRGTINAPEREKTPESSPRD